MPIPTPASCRVSPEAGTMSNGTGRYEKRLSDLAGLYADSAAFAALLADGDRVVYDVTEFRPSENGGDVIFGVTRMNPGRVGKEFFLTRGHIHAKSDRPEIYYGQKGTGLMQLESPDGETRIVEIGPQTICYVPPYWIHRSVNTGDEDLVMVFCYPADRVRTTASSSAPAACATVSSRRMRAGHWWTTTAMSRARRKSPPHLSAMPSEIERNRKCLTRPPASRPSISSA